MDLEIMLLEMTKELDDLYLNLKKTLTNKSAAQRARLNTIRLGKVFKNFRAVSIEYHKSCK